MVSVVVTVYNCIQYLRKAVESVMNQSMRDIEIILVDDGSTDGSSMLCEELKIEDNRVRVIHKENGGEVSARKAGLENARGKYIQFVDSDDWIEYNMVEELYAMAEREGADLVVSGWIIHKAGKIESFSELMPAGIYREGEKRTFFAEHLIWYEERGHGINGSLNTKLFRRELLKRVLPYVSDSIVYAEDDFAAYSCCALADCVAVTDKAYYHYMTDYSTINTSKNLFFLRDMNEGYVFFIKMTEKSSYFEIYKKAIDKYLIQTVTFGLNRFMGIEKSLYIPEYRFQTNKIPEKREVVLYGAGSVGKSFFRQFEIENKYHVIAWLDKNWDSLVKEGWNVISPDWLKKCKNGKFYIIIAIKNDVAASGIGKYLMEKFSIPKERIVWEKPKKI